MASWIIPIPMVDSPTRPTQPRQPISNLLGDSYHAMQGLSNQLQSQKVEDPHPGTVSNLYQLWRTDYRSVRWLLYSNSLPKSLTHSNSPAKRRKCAPFLRRPDGIKSHFQLFREKFPDIETTHGHNPGFPGIILFKKPYLIFFR